MVQGSLFSGAAEVVDVGDPACHVMLHPGHLTPDAADGLFVTLRDEVPWQEREMVVFGERHPVPRAEAWFGDVGADYGYSGGDLQRHDWHPALAGLRDRLAVDVGERFNGVLANRYRTGRDKVGWHADDEPELGPTPVIASVSLGAPRRFRIRHRDHGHTVALDLPHGSLLVMAGATQQRCVHELTATARPVEERINLTFRRIVSPGSRHSL